MFHHSSSISKFTKGKSNVVHQSQSTKQKRFQKERKKKEIRVEDKFMKRTGLLVERADRSGSREDLRASF